MKKYLLAILLLCGVAVAGDRYVLNVVGTQDGKPIVELVPVETPPPPPPEPEPTPAPDPAVRELLSTDQRATLKRLFADKHPWAVQARQMADWGPKPASGDFGQWATLVWLGTGDDAYAAKAIKQLDATFLLDPYDRNFSREYFGSFALHYKWLRPKLSDDQAREWRRRLLNWADRCLMPQGTGWGTRIGDSDETVGHYFGLVLTAKILAAEEPERCAVILADPQIAAMREEIKRLCKLAKGGEWVESSEYNLGTLQLLLIGAYGVGIEEYPEVATLALEVCEQQRWMTLPNHEYLDWGDVQQPHTEHLNARVGLLSLLAGLTGDPRPRSLLAELTQGKAIYPNYWVAMYRGLWCFDPSLAAEPYVAPAGFRSVGAGLVVHRGPKHFAVIVAPTQLGVDHQQSVFPDYRLWFDGEWVIDHPRGYETGAWTNNTALLCGFSRMANTEAVSIEETPTGCKVVTRMGGKLPNSFATFVDDWTRTTEFVAPSKFIVSDRFKGSRPDPERLAYQNLKDIAAKAPALWQAIQHTPIEPTATPDGFNWQTKGGKTVTLTGPPRRMVKRTENEGGYFNPDQLDGWQVRFLSDDPTAEIKTTVEVTR